MVDHIRATFEGATVYSATEGGEALKKMRNVPPRVLITGLDLGSKVTFHDLLRNMEFDRALASTPVLVLSDLSDTEPQFNRLLKNSLRSFFRSPEVARQSNLGACVAKSKPKRQCSA